MIETFLFKSALRDNLRLKRSLIWFGLAIFAGVLTLAFQLLDPRSTPEASYGVVSWLVVFRLLALSAAIYTTAIVTQEVEQRTIVYILTRPVPRWKILLMRYLAAAVTVAVVSIVAEVSASFFAFKGAGFSNPMLLPDIRALAVGAFAYCGLFLLFSLLFNRAMIFCLIYAFGWELSVPNLPGDISRLSIYTYLQSITLPTSAMQTTSSGTQTTVVPVAAWVGYLVLACIVVGTVGLSLYWFTKFEYVPREDAE